MGKKKPFHGWPEQSYGTKRALMRYYANAALLWRRTDLCVGNGAKSDIGNILDIRCRQYRPLVPDPVYPVYGYNVMAGRRIVYAATTRKTVFCPCRRQMARADLICLCSPITPRARRTAGSASGVGGLCE